MNSAITQPATVKSAPGIWLNAEDGWLSFEDLPPEYDAALRRFLATNGINLEQIDECSWRFDGSAKDIILVVDRFLDANGEGYLVQRHDDSMYSWVVHLPGSEVKDDTPEAGGNGDTPEMPYAYSWPTVVLNPTSDSGLDLEISPSIVEDVFRLLTMRGYELAPRQPGFSLIDESQSVSYHIEANLGDIRHALTEWLLRDDWWICHPSLTYIKDVVRPGELTKFVITEELFDANCMTA